MTAKPERISEPTAGRREWVGLAVLALPTLLLALDVSVLYLALPRLSADLGADSIQQLWITDIYGFLLAGFLVTMGTLGDRVGRRRLLLAGAAAFGAASVLAAYSTSAEMLIATRALLGVAGATLMPSTLALINTMFRNPRQQAVALSVWVSCFMGGAAIGPVVGGALLQTFWWGSAFLLGVPVMVLLLVTGPALLPEHHGTAAGRLDLRSVALSLATVLPVIYGLKELARDGWALLPAAAIVVGVAFGVAFVHRQQILEHPLLDLGLFRHRSFSAALVVWLLVGGVMGATGLMINLYLQLVEGLSPLRAGLWQVPSAVAMIAASLVSPVLARYFRPGAVMAAGLVVAAAGFGVLTQVGSSGGLAVLVPGIIVVTVGVGVGLPLGMGLILGAAPPERAGSAAAMSETSGELGIALGVAALGSVGAAVYRHQVADALPAGVPAGAADAARESLAGAVSAAAQLPGGVGADLLDSAREAFVTGLTTIAGASIVCFVALAVVTAALLRHVGGGGSAHEQPLEAGAVPVAGTEPASASV